MILFSDNVGYLESLEIVLIKKINSNFSQRSESNSNLWEDEGNGFISTPARSVKIGECIYNKDGSFRAYRVE